MKIGIVCYPTFGGSGVVATELGLALAERGHEVHFITYKQPVRLELLSHNIHFHEVSDNVHIIVYYAVIRCYILLSSANTPDMRLATPGCHRLRASVELEKRLLGADFPPLLKEAATRLRPAGPDSGS